MKFEKNDSVAFKNYKEVDYASCDAGHILALNDTHCIFSSEKAEYGWSFIELQELKKNKKKCDICDKKSFVKIYVTSHCGCRVIYVCDKCLKKKSYLKNLFETINGCDFSPHAIEDKEVVRSIDFWDNCLKEEMKKINKENYNEY